MNKKYLLRESLQTSRITRLIAKVLDLGIVLLLSLFFYPFGLMLGMAYLALCDSFNYGQSFGKKLMGFAVISLEDGSACSYKQSIIRNLPLLIPLAFAIIPFWGWIFCGILSFILVLLEVYLLFKLDSGHRLGDVMADTSVIANDPSGETRRKNKDTWFESEKPAIS
ncbi:MAG: RDD family protein [Bacteriovoracaceae bacterium]|nr:RDD family protein [Bacteriovoracaceae bacterium]